jgi:hypothetical protein
MSKSLRIGALTAFALAAASEFAQSPPRSDDQDGGITKRKGDHPPTAKIKEGHVQKETNSKKNGTDQNE